MSGEINAILWSASSCWLPPRLTAEKPAAAPAPARAETSTAPTSPPPIRLSCSGYLAMASKSVWRSLHYSAKRRTAVPPTPYRCFSCSLRARQAETGKPEENTRMTHFGFETIPESQKESKGWSRSPLVTFWTNVTLTMPPCQWAPCLVPSQGRMTR